MSGDFYSDDPIEDFSSPVKKKFSSIFAVLLLLVGGTYFVQTTLAANISLNSGAPVEFGQGVTATTACSGATNLTITPNATFTNASGSGAFKFSSLTVSNIPSGCNGKDFTINAYGSTDSTPLALFNTTSTTAVVYSNAGTFELGVGTLTGASITSGSGTFTITFTNPVALSSSVFKLTIQSGAHAETSAVYTVGQSGPGGGTIFYVDNAGFDCGSSFTSTGSPTGGKCKYLEVAPSLWAGGSADPKRLWAVSAKQNTDIPEITDDVDGSPNLISSEIGLGYKNSLAIVAQGNDNTTAAFVARGYNGGSKSDWYLPTMVELNLLCQWVRGVAPSVTTLCTGGSINSATYGASSAGFAADGYWSSSEVESDSAWLQTFLNGNTFNYGWKGQNHHVRPIRAF